MNTTGYGPKTKIRNQERRGVLFVYPDLYQATDMKIGSQDVGGNLCAVAQKGLCAQPRT